MNHYSFLLSPLEANNTAHKLQTDLTQLEAQLLNAGVRKVKLGWKNIRILVSKKTEE